MVKNAKAAQQQATVKPINAQRQILRFIAIP